MSLINNIRKQVTPFSLTENTVKATITWDAERTFDRYEVKLYGFGPDGLLNVPLAQGVTTVGTSVQLEEAFQKVSSGQYRLEITPFIGTIAQEVIIEDIVKL